MQERDEMQGLLMDLLAQVRGNLAPSQLEEIERLAAAGSHRQAVESICRFAREGQHPMPLQARAVVFKLADRLGIDPADLGMLG
jgi:hypothetical protein